MDIERTYNVSVSPAHRQAFGQFFTPLPLAAFMVQWALGEKVMSVFDPAVGLGVFFQAAEDIRPGIGLRGCEIDPVVLNYLQNSAGFLAESSIIIGDYLSIWGQRHQAIVCNPPYMRFQNFKNRTEVISQFETHLNVRLSGYTNTSSAFLLKSLGELEFGARLAYVMPLEFLNAGYGTRVKTCLLEGGKLKAIIRMESEREVFPEVITSIGIVLVANDGLNNPVAFYNVSSMEELKDLFRSEAKLSCATGNLSPNEKWLKYFDTQPTIIRRENLVSIRNYGNFSRGIATGANEFFILSPSRARKLEIPRSALSKCIAKSNQLKHAVFNEEDLHKLEEEDADVLLLDVKGDPKGPVQNYILHGESNGFNLRYLTKMRKPWYKVENRHPAPLLFGVFSRGKFKVIRNNTSALNLTCFHGFHPHMFGTPYIDKLYLYFQSETARKILGMSMRRYGDGLDKFEPNDLNEALAPAFSWFDCMPDRLVELGLASCSAGTPLPLILEELFNELLSSPAISQTTSEAGRKEFRSLDFINNAVS